MIAAVFSGGKDSTISAFLMAQQGFEVELVTFVPKKKHSYMLHGETLNLTPMQAEAMGMPHHIFEVSGEKEEEVYEMADALASLQPSGISSGALASEYQRQRIDVIGEWLSVPTYAPLWKRPHVVRDFLKHMDVRLSKVAAEGLGKELLGKSIDKLFGMAERHAFIGDPLLEGGEGETVVLDAPFFSKRLLVKKAHVEWHNSWGEWVVEEAVLEEKG